MTHPHNFFILMCPTQEKRFFITDFQVVLPTSHIRHTRDLT